MLIYKLIIIVVSRNSTDERQNSNAERRNHDADLVLDADILLNVMRTLEVCNKDLECMNHKILHYVCSLSDLSVYLQ